MSHDNPQACPVAGNCIEGAPVSLSVKQRSIVYKNAGLLFGVLSERLYDSPGELTMSDEYPQYMTYSWRFSVGGDMHTFLRVVFFPNLLAMNVPLTGNAIANTWIKQQAELFDQLEPQHETKPD